MAIKRTLLGWDRTLLRNRTGVSSGQRRHGYAGRSGREVNEDSPNTVGI